MWLFPFFVECVLIGDDQLLFLNGKSIHFTGQFVYFVSSFKATRLILRVILLIRKRIVFWNVIDLTSIRLWSCCFGRLTGVHSIYFFLIDLKKIGLKFVIMSNNLYFLKWKNCFCYNLIINYVTADCEENYN